MVRSIRGSLCYRATDTDWARAKSRSKSGRSLALIRLHFILIGPASGFLSRRVSLLVLLFECHRDEVFKLEARLWHPICSWSSRLCSRRQDFAKFFRFCSYLRRLLQMTENGGSGRFSNHSMRRHQMFDCTLCTGTPLAVLCESMALERVVKGVWNVFQSITIPPPRHPSETERAVSTSLAADWWWRPLFSN